MALQSEFHTDMSKVEPIVWKSFTKPQLIMILMITPAFILIGVEVFLIKGWLFWPAALATAVIFITPAVLKTSGKIEQVRATWFFNMKIQKRYYSTGKIRKYTPDEFVQKKEVKETDSFTD
ncbi:hypothetical protein WOSG25_090270 [Weissella oryzae SG25]|uniref:PrgI family protein n=1 Tax=Weissella oryzae (strain DSM 25784 / JCM 18191 / LMG 30913 / SG25) TaxID=1329250 RepID=A0A069CU79_WEIOS|nr:hypothetical protein [Weissella oryzae]GAK31330.1 hypothetical protein WOSG25_090270 [Weissella oryzae SG25]